MQLKFILQLYNRWVSQDIAMVLNQLTIDKDIHSYIFGVTVGVRLLVAWLQEVNWV